MKKVITIALVLITLLSLCACGGTKAPEASAPAASAPAASAPAEAVPENKAEAVAADEYITVKLGIPSELGDLITSGAVGDCYGAMDAVFDTIFYCDPVTREWTSDILTEWGMEDEHTMVCKMRDDIYFSNGANATAEDLMYSFLCHSEDGLDHWITAMKLIPEECEVRDTYTVAFAVTEKSQDFYSRDNHLLCKAWVKEVGFDNPEAWYDPVASGPYYVADHQPGEYYVLKLKDDPWQGRENYIVEEYDIIHYADTTTAYMALEVGDIDFTRVNKTEFKRASEEGTDAGIGVVQVATGVTTNFYMPGHICDVWNNKLVREAVLYGVNWVELDQIMFGELAMPATSVTPSDSPLWVECFDHTFDPEKAKELLAEAGYEPGEIKIETTLFETEKYKSFGEAVTYYLDQIGIKADITYGDTATTLAVWNAGLDTDFAMHVNPAGSPGRNICQSIQGITGENVNFTKVENAELQAMWSQLAPLYDAPLADKQQLATDIQKLIADEILVIPFHEDNTAMAYNASLINPAVLAGYTTADNNYKLSRMGYRANWE